jgi:hypothetical protein
MDHACAASVDYGACDQTAMAGIKIRLKAYKAGLSRFGKFREIGDGRRLRLQI